MPSAVAWIEPMTDHDRYHTGALDHDVQSFRTSGAKIFRTRWADDEA